MMERLKHEGTSHNSSDLLKFYVKMGASLSARYHLGLVLFPFLLPEDLAHLVFTDMNCRCRGEGLLEVLMVVWRGVQSECGLFFQTCNRTHSDCLPVVDSPQCWGMVSCSWLSLSDLSTLKLSHWKRIGSLACQVKSPLFI